jgi:hypothetical protein
VAQTGAAPTVTQPQPTPIDRGRVGVEHRPAERAADHTLKQQLEIRAETEKAPAAETATGPFHRYIHPSDALRAARMRRG